MPKVTLTLAEPASIWIDARVEAGDWPTREAYVEALIAREREDAEKLAYVREAVAQGLASGPSGRTIDDIVREGRARRAKG